MRRLAFAPLLLLAAAGCRDATTPQAAGSPPAHPSLTVVPLWPDTIGICISPGSPSGDYGFQWQIINGQPDDIHDATSPDIITLGPGTCIVPWRRLAPLPAGVVVTLVVDEISTPPNVVFDSAELQDDFVGDRTSFTSIGDTVRADTIFGGAVTFYHQLAPNFQKNSLLVPLGPLPGPDPSQATGRATLVVKPGQLPPGPCDALRGTAHASAVGICANIHNPGGETFTGGTLTVMGQTFPFATGLFPPGPCRTYVLHGAAGVPAGLVTQLTLHAAGASLVFTSVEHPAGAIGGSGGGSGGASPAGAVIHNADAASPSSGRGECVIRFGAGR